MIPRNAPPSFCYPYEGNKPGYTDIYLHYNPGIVKPANANNNTIKITPISQSAPPLQFIPRNAYCKNCKENVRALGYPTPGPFVWMMFFLLCIVSPCISFFVFFIPSWQKNAYKCAKCNRKVGV